MKKIVPLLICFTLNGNDRVTIDASSLPFVEGVPSVDLKSKRCVPCEGGVKPFNEQEESTYLKSVNNWEIDRSGVHKIKRSYVFKDFKEAMKFVNAVADVAESQGHHPDISISWNKVSLELYTHAIKGLSENDFILAAHIDEHVRRFSPLGRDA